MAFPRNFSINFFDFNRVKLKKRYFFLKFQPWRNDILSHLMHPSWFFCSLNVWMHFFDFIWKPVKKLILNTNYEKTATKIHSNPEVFRLCCSILCSITFIANTRRCWVRNWSASLKKYWVVCKCGKLWSKMGFKKHLKMEVV